jgi:thymidylate synthase
MSFECTHIEARDLPDAWFLCLQNIVLHGHNYLIDRGSYEGQHRMEFDYITVHVRYPGTRPLIPDIPAHLGIPNPVEPGYVEEYLPYLMEDTVADEEEYTYGMYLKPQIEEVIRMYKEDGHGTNQACMAVGEPDCIQMKDPPCLRSIDTRIRYGQLHFIVYFRSWDLWNGFPANLAAIQMLKEYMAAELGVEDGTLTASSKGLHVYEYAWDLARLRLMMHELPDHFRIVPELRSSKTKSTKLQDIPSASPATEEKERTN